MAMDRREFMRQGSLAALSMYLSGCASSQIIKLGNETMLEIPDLSDANITGVTVGIRPYRKKAVRLERTEQGGKILVHNYGHGGAGFTLAWGSAEVAADFASDGIQKHYEVAVLGAGVVGLSTAKVLQERGYKVTLYAENFTPHTTSDQGGAQWSPSAVAKGETIEEKRLFLDLLVRSYRRYEKMHGQKYGISKRPNYVAEGFGGPLDLVPPGLIPPPVAMPRLPFPGPVHRGRLFFTFLIEPPVYLPALMHDIQAAGASFVTKTFSNADEIRNLPQRVVINCTGLGAGKIYTDTQLVPIRGQLVHLRPKDLPYLLIHEGYIFPRRDAVILGGSFEEGSTDTTPDPMTTKRILDLSRKYFGLSSASEMPSAASGRCT